MQQVKLFKGVESEIHQLESDINEWLMSNNVQVVSLQSNIAPQSVGDPDTTSSLKGFAPSDVLVVLLYEKM